MPSLKGKVESISVLPLSPKQLANPKTVEYGYTHKIGFRVKDQWFNCGNCKGDSPYINKEIGVLGEGDELEFMYSDGLPKPDGNGTFNPEVKRPSLELIKKAPVKVQKAIEKAKGKATPNPSEVGQALNIAIHLGVFKTVQDALDPNNQREAIINYRTIKDSMTALWDAAVNEPQPYSDDGNKALF